MIRTLIIVAALLAPAPLAPDESCSAFCRKLCEKDPRPRCVRECREAHCAP